MAYKVKKTEHAGPKNGGGYWGLRADAKHESSRARRIADRSIVEAETALDDGTLEMVSLDGRDQFDEADEELA